MKKLAGPVAIALLLAIAIVSLWTPLSHPEVASRWFARPNIVFFSPVPILVLLVTWALLRTLKHDSHAAPFLLALVLLFLGYTGLAISLWPHIIPPAISIWDAAASPQTMGFTLVGALFVIPFILAYTAWSYYVFRGKVRLGEGYH
jgi:cytochrome d ubiquinol oxidase subunit II